MKLINATIFLDMSSFIKDTGLLDENKLKKLFPKFTRSIDIEEDGGFDAHGTNLTKLLKLVATNPDLHIITETDEDGIPCYSNSIRYVNRMKYYLGNGNKNDNIECIDDDTPDNWSSMKEIVETTMNTINSKGQQN